jgi:hypothetical protein
MYQCVSGVYTPLTVGPASRLIGAKLTSSVGISVPDSGAAAVPFNQELFDSDTLHDNVVNNSRLVCKFPGIYILGGLLDFSANATGIRAIFIRLNGVSTLQLANFVPVAASPYTGNTVTQVTGIFNLALNDYVELMGGQTSGLALNTAAGPPATPQFWMIKVA